METSFIKFKKKIILEIVIKCLIISVTTGLLVFSIPYLILKLTQSRFNVLYLILIGVGVMLILFGLLFLIFKPNDQKVAVKLDQKLNLNQKVQTMIEYQNEDGLMVKLQRENTNKILSGISLKNLSMKFSAIFFILIGLSVSICITAFAMPTPKIDDPSIIIEDPNYELDDWTILAIRDLIKYIDESAMNDSLKAKDINELNGLIDELKTADKESEMVKAVEDVIGKLELELDIINTNNEIHEVLRVTNHLSVTKLSAQINDLNIDAISNAVDGFITAIANEAAAINDVDVSFGQVLKSSSLNKTDEAYLALINLNQKLLECKNEQDVFTAVTNVVNEQKEAILSAFRKQLENKTVTEYVVSELREIFGLNESNDSNNPDGNDPDSNPSDPEDPNANIPPHEGDYDGGYGTGEVIFGSDDSMFDPNRGKVEFSEVISNYQNDIIGRLEAGKIPEELKEYFEYYYDILFGTLEDEE